MIEMKTKIWIYFSKYPVIKEMIICLWKKKEYTQNYCLLNQILICNENYGLNENVVNIYT